MKTLTRRQFIVAGATLTLAATRTKKPAQPTLRKALIRGLPDEKTLLPLKEAGFHGIECNAWNVEPAKAEAARKIADSLGMRIHSVLRGWTRFNEPQHLTEDLASVETALRTAQIYGADAILLVPCRIGGSGMKIPKPRQFQIEFDERTGHIRRVVAGDNTPYTDYIRAHNEAVDASRAAFEKLIPLAEKYGVVIAHENVWNNLWVQPAIFANFVASFKSRWLRAYFDIGNHLKYAPSEQWIAALGNLVVKCHIKDFKLNEDPGGDGKFVDPLDGDVNWPAVRRALDKIGYQGWLTIEGSAKLPLDDLSRRLDKIIAS
ncbi:MAG: sugar phosphate isomerase/epimerase [Verrucomicrobiae bacterium]|nr:sugar phosphate isomerase/epimerase [Verrucomicrobiae bacterium]